jgi:threonyl-tRNA synthetase
MRRQPPALDPPAPLDSSITSLLVHESRILVLLETADASGSAVAAAGRQKTRLTKESGDRIAASAPGAGKIGGAFTLGKDPSWLKDRAAVYEEVVEAQKARLAAKPKVPIRITLPDGAVKEGVSWTTTPLAIAEGISKGLAGSVVVAKVTYTGPRHGLEAADGASMVNTGPSDEDEDGELMQGGVAVAKPAAEAKPELWDLTRPLEGDCLLELKRFDDKEGKMVFWHSSAHVLGECLECNMGGKLCIGPPTEEGFYYDAYVGTHSITDADYPALNSKAEAIAKEKQPFERIVLTKEQALRMFADNPFKTQIIQNKIPDGGYTTAYRCGPLIDLCMGPHVPSTGAIKAFEVTKNSAAYWLGNKENDSLQRVYGISFPDAKQLKAYKVMVEEAKKRDHRVLGTKQELFFFHELSPGSCFFLPHGTRIYNRLMEYIKRQYVKRGYHEVVTPNMFNLDLWRISGHADHYLENMFTFDVEGQGFGLKPMNCPGHCLCFDNRVRSYKELPLRLADFGVLHRNEFSGALSGLTRVRRFQQDDAHIFCRFDQIRDEVMGALDFMQSTYGIFGFSFELHLSTRPKKALGSLELWNQAESMMTEALNSFGRPWKLNPGDGAFYGPKIDIKVFDALGRAHQCATIQLDFQLPIRFNLRYKASGNGAGALEGGETEEGAEGAEGKEEPAAAAAADKKKGGKKDKKDKKEEAAAKAEEGCGHEHHKHDGEHKHVPKNMVEAAVARVQSGATDDLPDGFERPVIIHRAILGSVERMMAVLIEHTGGKWPFWLSPRQISIVPVAQIYIPYAKKIGAILHDAGFYVDVDASTNTLNKKVREAQVAQFNFILVVGEKEEADGSVNIRTRDNKIHGTQKIEDAVKMFKELADTYQ